MIKRDIKLLIIFICIGLGCVVVSVFLAYRLKESLRTPDVAVVDKPKLPPMDKRPERIGVFNDSTWIILGGNFTEYYHNGIPNNLKDTTE